MLRKIESELWYLSEMRDYIAARPKQERTDLERLENDQDKLRKERRRKRNQEAEDALIAERERRNEEKKEKQRNLRIFKGHPLMERAKKKELKPKQKKDEKPSQEVIDQLRYLGQKVD
jgi:hypothetical protein